MSTTLPGFLVIDSVLMIAVPLSIAAATGSDLLREGVKSVGDLDG